MSGAGSRGNMTYTRYWTSSQRPIMNTTQRIISSLGMSDIDENWRRLWS
jgi:hypothetical protein